MTAMMDLTTMSQREAPRRLRHGALRHLAERLSGDGVLFFSLDERSGALHFGQVIAMGKPEFERRCEALAGKPLLEGAVGPGDVYDLHNAIGRRGDRLTPLAEEYQHPEQGLRSPWWRTVIEPFGYENHLRMPLYNNENLLVGVVIVLGKSEPLITNREFVRKLERETRDALLLADMFERPERPGEPLYALFTTEGGLSMVSEETPRWLDRERRELCAEHVQALLAEKVHRRTTAIDGMHLQFERLEGEDLSVLVIITAQRAPQRLLTDVLSEEQRRIAEFIAVGATEDEVARHFGLERDEMGSKVQMIYGLLGVRSRTGLVRALRRD